MTDMPNISTSSNSTTPMWDKAAKIPIIGNVTSFVRIPVNVLKGLFAIINYVGSKITNSKTIKAKAQFKASVSGFSKGIMGTIPIIGTIAAIYLFKNTEVKHPDKQENVNKEADKSAHDVKEVHNTGTLVEGETAITQKPPQASKKKKRTTSVAYPWSKESIRDLNRTLQKYPVGRDDGTRNYLIKENQKRVEVNEDSPTLQKGLKSEETNPQVLNFKRKLFAIDIQTDENAEIMVEGDLKIKAQELLKKMDSIDLSQFEKKKPYQKCINNLKSALKFFSTDGFSRSSVPMDFFKLVLNPKTPTNLFQLKNEADDNGKYDHIAVIDEVIKFLKTFVEIENR